MLVIPGVTFTASNRIVHASAVRATTVPLESLPITNNNGVRKLSSSNSGHYLGSGLEHGLQVTFGQKIQFKLNKKYDMLSGVIYVDDQAGGSAMDLTISDSSDAASPKILWQHEFGNKEEVSISIPVRQVKFVTLADGGNNTSDAFDVVATLSPRATSSSSRTGAFQVIPRYPTGNAAVPVESKVLFGWKPFLGAANYAFHVWMVSQSGSAMITDSTPFSFSASIHRKTSYTWNNHGFLPGTYQYALLPLDAHGKALAAWSTPTQITIVS